MITTEKRFVRIDSHGCRCLLPHRDVMALIDGVSVYTPEDRSLRAFKRIATNEFVLRGHFPRQPIFPASLVIEALAQACGIMMNMERMRDDHQVDLYRLDDRAYLETLPPIPLSVLADSSIKQYRQAYPGDTLGLEVKIAMQRHDFRYFKVAAKVEDLTIADGSILLSYPQYFNFDHNE
jgi:3-hydroxyacyl-[acyl-carrier-protein] dehydratase